MTDIRRREEDEQESPGPAFRRPGTKLPAEYSLMMVPDEPGDYRLLSQFEYVAPDYSPDSGKRFLVPRDARCVMETDLASIPFFASWLVPKDGKHTPAAFLHDALVKDQERARTVRGPHVRRHEADRIFRGAMQELGVPLIRRALMWAAVSLATLVKVRPLWRGILWGLVIGVTAVTGLVFNLLWVNRLFDGSLRWAADLPGLSWIIQRLESVALWVDERLGFLPDSRLLLLGIVVGAVVVMWGRWVGVGALTASGVMLFGYPLLVAAWSFLVYWVLEKIVEWFLRGLKRTTGFARGPINVPGILRTKVVR